MYVELSPDFLAPPPGWFAMYVCPSLLLYLVVSLSATLSLIGKRNDRSIIPHCTA